MRARIRIPTSIRTRDAGKSWQRITDGLQPGWIARVIREDPVRKGLLYAGTENALYVSFDDGDHWQSLQLNFPVSDVRDLAVHGRRYRCRHLRPRNLDPRRHFAASPGRTGNNRR